METLNITSQLNHQAPLEYAVDNQICFYKITKTSISKQLNTMVTINNTASLPYPNSKSPLAKPYFITSSTSLKFVLKSTPKPFLIRCSSSNNNSPKGRTSNSLKDALTGMVGKEVEDLLSREENRELLDGLVEASDRVERAKRALADIERQQLEADQLKNYVNQLETRAYEVCCFFP